ncbi:hypothetical protein COV15_00750 [Candidatus Woesearchaeota archaeon CG10_big_fil_rev_8_21_14_0_10_34_12]|nr:MAG: hypothetical protein COV15_00750 [Candidatus Woesearchaeota archaeon CG10_big_fil_rev_8_21_14_0_10_34_12]
MADNLYTLIDYKTALEAREQILSSQMEILKILEKIKKFKKLRKQEFSEKNNFKVQLKEFSEETEKLSNTLPKPEFHELNEKEVRVKEIKGKKRIESELKEIQKRLGNLR